LIVKVCGITTPGDAEDCIAAGVDWLGLNFVPSSPRCIDVATARSIRDVVRSRALLVGVVANRGEAELRDLVRDAGLDSLQLHGDESPALVAQLAPHAFKAVRVGSAADLALADTFTGLLLLDAKVEGALGGTGHPVDVALAGVLARSRPILLAGGLRPENVAEAIRAVRPWGVDTASGVERSPGVKDLDAVRAFVHAARGA
jgi:phosphoribosylanthranilate isomerase